MNDEPPVQTTDAGVSPAPDFTTFMRNYQNMVFSTAARLTGNANGPVVILVSSRDSSDFGPLVMRSGARGFVPKAELSGDRLQELL